MDENKLSNLYTPNFSKWIEMKAIKELEVELDSSKIDDDEQMHKYLPPIGIADACWSWDSIICKYWCLEND